MHYAAANSAVFRCALKIVMVAEVFVAGQRVPVFQITGAGILIIHRPNQYNQSQNIFIIPSYVARESGLVAYATSKGSLFRSGTDLIALLILLFFLLLELTSRPVVSRPSKLSFNSSAQYTVGGGLSLARCFHEVALHWARLLLGWVNRLCVYPNS